MVVIMQSTEKPTYIHKAKVNATKARKVYADGNKLHIE